MSNMITDSGYYPRKQYVERYESIAIQCLILDKLYKTNGLTKQEFIQAVRKLIFTANIYFDEHSLQFDNMLLTDAIITLKIKKCK